MRHPELAGWRRGDGVGPDPRAVLGHPGQAGGAGVDQGGGRLGHQGLEGLGVGVAEVGERVVIDRLVAADPAVGHVDLGEPGDLARGPDAVEQDHDPERRQDPGVQRRGPRP